MLEPTQPSQNDSLNQPETGEFVNHRSPALQRLMDEIRNKEGLSAIGGKYDRTHNRHNRGQ